MRSLLLDYTDLLLAALNAGIAIVVALQLRQVGIRLAGPAGALLLYFTLRAAGRVVDAPQLPPTPNSTLSQVIDALSILAALYLLTQTRRLVNAFRYEQDHARLRVEEYERARRHYTQVVRHRMLNPLTVITGTLQTLRDGPTLESDTRIALCDSALAAADELESVSLHPERRDALEHDLDAIPRAGRREGDAAGA
jgi:signal transduction histidine kinase